MRPLKNLKEVHKLNGKIVALSRFIPKSAEKCSPFFRILRKPGKTIRWNEECEKAFTELKKTLEELPTLHLPNSTDPLFLYVSCSETTISAILVTEEGKNQNPVFYLSKNLQGAESRYPPLEKLALAIIVSARRLRAYFQSYQIVVSTSYPLLQTLHKPYISGRLAKWAIELSGYDIRFVPAKAIKAQALADFIAELTPENTNKEETEETRILKVDGVAGKNRCGAGIILQRPEKLQLEYAIHFSFRTTNNEAEYEALLAGLEVAEEIGVRSLVIFTDSQLVVSQVKGTFEVNEQKLLDYKELVIKSLKIFREVELNLVKRNSIEEADMLAKLGTAKNTEQDKWIQVRALPCSAIQAYQENLEITQEEEDWRTKIKNFITGKEIPEDRMELKKIRNQAAQYVMQEKDLYRRKAGTGTFLLRICVTLENGKDIAKSVHSGGGGSHQRGKRLYLQVLRQGYFWPTIKTDTRKNSQECTEC